MKKVLFVIESLHLGGAEKSLLTLLHNLDYNKLEVDLMIFKDGGIFQKLVPKPINLILKSYPNLTFKDRFLFKVSKLIYKSKYHAAQLFWKIINPKLESHTSEYDIAIAYNQGFSTYYVENKIQAQKKYAWLNTDYQKAGYAIKFDFPIYQSFKKIVAVSEEAKQSLKNELSSINKDLNIEVIKDISDETIIKKQGKETLETELKKTAINIVTVARLVKYKGLHLAIESCKILIENGHKINWYVIGEGIERDKLKALIKEYQLENHFFLLGAKENPYPYIKACDIYVQTSLFEGLGLTVIEASILEKPIVCTNFSTAFSIIKQNETGLICEMDSDSISQNIEELIQNRVLKEKFIENLQKVKNNDKEITLEKINQLLEFSPQIKPIKTKGKKCLL